jgi:hypothetical protein
MFKKQRPFGQMTEVTHPLLAIVGALAIATFAAAAFSFWPNTQTLRTEPTANLPDNQKGTAEAPGSPRGTQ